MCDASLIRQTTSVEQSEKLIKLGFGKFTCDAYHWYAEGTYYTYFGKPTDENAIPAWTLGALIHMFEGYSIRISGQTITVDGIHYGKYNDIYDNLIHAIKDILCVPDIKYPKNFDECKAILDNPFTPNFVTLGTRISYDDIFDAYKKLIMCRDAYWKVLGYLPSYEGDEEKFCIYTFNNEVRKAGTSHRQAVLSFPTEEARDIFFKNFKETIILCKNLI